MKKKLFIVLAVGAACVGLSFAAKPIVNHAFKKIKFNYPLEPFDEE